MPARHIYYSGKVQGVGFRYTAKQIATGFEVTGWIRNLPDGRVEMTVMADELAELDSFLDELENNSPLRHHIKEIDSRMVPPLEGVKGFTIER